MQAEIRENTAIKESWSVVRQALPSQLTSGHTKRILDGVQALPSLG
jgi:hypothetical protein